MCENLSVRSLACKAIAPIFTKLEGLRDKRFDMSIDMEGSASDLSYLESMIAS